METSNGFGSVGRAFASNINGSQFKARYWQKKLIHKFTVNCWKKKRSWMAHFKRWWNYEMVVVDAIKADNNRPTVLIFKHSDALINFFLIQSERSKPTQYNFLYRFGPRPKARFLKPTSRQCITRILPQSVKQKMENIFSAAPLSHAPKIDCKFFFKWNEWWWSLNRCFWSTENWLNLEPTWQSKVSSIYKIMFNFLLS